jgi:formylglycine-generating enzyme
MVAIPGGTFEMGSPPDEPFRNDDEGPVRRCRSVLSLWHDMRPAGMSFLPFIMQRLLQEGRIMFMLPTWERLTGLPGPTPPWGLPDQGWGMGSRPAITMTWHAADTYCEWLS